MKKLLLIFTAMLFGAGISGAQEVLGVVMLGNQAGCMQTGFGPPEFSCNKYLTLDNGSLQLSNVTKDDKNALWEMIILPGANEDEVFYNFRNTGNGKFLCIENGSLKCSQTDGSKSDAIWNFWETDVATGVYFLTSKMTNEMIISENGKIKFSNNESAFNDNARYDSKFDSYHWVTVSKVENTGSNNDPGMVTTDPTTGTNLKSESAEILERHNYWRSELGIAPLVWSDELTAYAQDWADQLAANGCSFEHRTNGKYGENLYWAMGGNLTGVDAVESWASEKKDFDVNTQEGNGEVVGHYTQMIWENTTRVGCAMSKCSDGSVIWVCNYDPPGNYSGQKPWKKK